MDLLSNWLRHLDMQRYSQAFAENDIDMETLLLLTESDLEQLGVSLGHRKKMLRAIEELKAPAIEPSKPNLTEAGTLSPNGERRHLTVLFCDMVGYTELANRIDPEALHGIVNAYEELCVASVARYEGYVFQRLGDGIVAFFGYPVAHEDEAERANLIAYLRIQSDAPVPLP